MKNRSNITNILNLSLAGALATFQNASKSEAASNAASMAARMSRTWEQIFDYGNKLRSDTTRPQLEREHLLAQFAQKQIQALSPSVQSAMTRLNERRDKAQGRIDALHQERDSLTAIQGQEARAYLRTLSALERAQALTDPALAKAASCGAARLSGISDMEQAQLRQIVAAREQPDACQEIADVEMGTEMLMMASQSLISNTAVWTDQETVDARVDAPASIDQYAA